MEMATDRVATATRAPQGSAHLVPDTMAVLDEFQALADTAAGLLARGQALRAEWEAAGDTQAGRPDDEGLATELAEWTERAVGLVESESSYRPVDVATVVVGHPLPGYFVG